MFTLRTCLIAVALAAVTLSAAPPPPSVSLIGKGAIPGTALDLSDLQGEICEAAAPNNCIPKSLLGGLGSALTYTGFDNVFMSAPDRGPFDGLTDVPYLDRIQFLYMSVDTAKPFPNIKTVLLDTRFLKNESGEHFVGASDGFSTSNPLATLRLDPEGIRVGPGGTFFLSDEYGPYLFEFDRQGHIERRLAVPSRLLIANSSEDANEELLLNLSGRQANRGMEGLAITPDGRYLVGLMQNALIQDAGLNGLDRLGVCNRLVKIDLATDRTQEYVYVLEAINRGQGANELLAINDHEFLVLDRDNRSYLKPGDPQLPTRKKIYKIDLDGATDVSGVARLPPSGADLAARGITPVTKTLYLDLLADEFGLKNTIPEKIEGLAWGPDLPDGRHVLYVMSDNDLNPLLDTQIYAFAVSNLNVKPSVLPGPMFPPGQVKKILRQQ
jgi:hypothetical protein